MKENVSNKKNAFTIVETLITILAITIMISGPLLFMQRSYNYAELVKAKIMATSLSQEGIELLTSLRNKNLNNFTTLAPICAKGCMVDWDGISDAPSLEFCNGDSCKLFTQSSNASYGFRKTGDTETGFYRYVVLQPSGTQGYVVESFAYTYINEVKVEVVLKKVMSNLEIK